LVETGTSNQSQYSMTVSSKKTTEALHINVATKPLGTIDDAKSAQIIVQSPRWLARIKIDRDKLRVLPLHQRIRMSTFCNIVYPQPVTSDPVHVVAPHIILIIPFPDRKLNTVIQHHPDSDHQIRRQRINRVEQVNLNIIPVTKETDRQSNNSAAAANSL
jgi:hypothetical protein